MWSLKRWLSWSKVISMDPNPLWLVSLWEKVIRAQTHTERRPREDAGRREASEDTDLDFQPPWSWTSSLQKWRNTFLLFNTPASRPLLQQTSQTDIESHKQYWMNGIRHTKIKNKDDTICKKLKIRQHKEHQGRISLKVRIVATSWEVRRLNQKGVQVEEWEGLGISGIFSLVVTSYLLTMILYL